MMNNSYSPIREHEKEGTENYIYEEPSSSMWCGCFKFPCFQTQEVEANSLLQERDYNNKESSSWMVKKMKELKEYSELVAGPKWKNFVRKIGKYCNPNTKKRTQGFHYDSQSYALNFDEGGGVDSVEDDGLLRNFSSRFAAPFSAINQSRSAGL